MKPISPSDILKLSYNKVPDFIVEVFNDLIVRHFTANRASFSQDEAIQYIIAYKKDTGDRYHAGKLNRQDIFNYGWLNIETLYRAEGWNVTYSKASYNEDANSFFTFTC